MTGTPLRGTGRLPQMAWGGEEDMPKEITTWREAEEAFNEMIDEVYPHPRIMEISFSPSRILQELDGGYQTLLVDWLDGEGINSDTFTD